MNLQAVSPMLRRALIRSCYYSKLLSSPSACYVCTISKVARSEEKLGNYLRSKYSSFQSKTCWKCDSAVEKYDLFCSGCNTIQKLDTGRNYFDLFGINERYSVDPKLIQKTFRDLQRQLHPDLYSNKDEEEKKLSEEHSSLVNKAYSVLNHPLRRAQYMLLLKGVDIEKAPADLSQEFLMEIMERNEEVDGLEDEDKIHHLSLMYKNVMMELSKEAEKAFDKGDLEKAKEVVAKMKYFYNLEMKVQDLKRKYGIMD
ncbi:iron-sulfur cluster co-chaperone protein HscB [Ischnura elegans]|uniref:iron-sulfur cluster co-chaperone protein HscB n=1 Tax=Ischnura elegans TaxID=197161 RepID=UPI001ED86A00|nr:iron-sulfur cluster co-chaperone protein HscB [Ischnura elegans]